LICYCSVNDKSDIEVILLI